MESTDTSEVRALSGSEVYVKENSHVRISYGPDSEGNFIIHVEQLSMSRPFPSNPLGIYSIIKKDIRHILDLSDKVDVYPSPDDWDFKMYTLKARNLNKKCLFYIEDLEKALEKLLEDLKKYLDSVSPRKTFR